MREVRLRFSKTGRLKYISHLDINRAMSRALKRAGIPLWYTEGFNPHPYMSFSLPLSLGVESLCESVDLRITGEITNKEIKDRLNSVLPEDLKIVDVYDDFRDNSEIVYSDYVYKFEFADNDLALEKIKNVLFYCQDQKTEVNIFVKKNKEDIYCFVMMEGNKIIYASEIPEDDCPIIKKFLK